MGWDIKGWMCGGYVAAREDGELVFIYRRPDWGTGMSGLKAFYELRNRGAIVARLTADNSWKPLLRAEWLAGMDRPLSEADLLEIAEKLNP